MRKFLLHLLMFAVLRGLDANAQSTETFVPTGNMNSARLFHTATLLKDGRVLMTGGYTSGQSLGPRSCLKSAELYDPATETFTETGEMSIARANHTAILLPDGRVFVVGGCSGTVSGDVYDPATGTFTGVGNIPGRWWGFATTLLKDGRVLLSGGTAGTASLSPLALLYNPAANRFSATNGITGGGASSTANLLPDGTVLVAGGSNGSWSPFNDQPFDDPTTLYNPATDQFEELSTGPGRIIYQTATSLTNGKVLLAGGAVDVYGDNAQSQATLYEPASRSFTTTGNLTRRRALHTATLLKDGRALITGGYNGEGPDSETGIWASAELYDPSTERFVATRNMSWFRVGHTATLIRDGRVLIAGGWDGLRNDADATAELFVPASIQGQVPTLSLDKAQYCAGDAWQLRINDASASSSVQLMGISQGTPWEVRNWETTDTQGTLTANGSFRADAVGDHTLWALADGKTTNSIVIKIVSCSK